jgi:Kdo2-lipid IVA lauroyltransferase/acyltransferase
MRAKLIIAFLRFFSHLSLKQQHRLGAIIGKLFMFFPKLRLVQTSRINIAYCFPHYTAKQQAQLLRESVQETAKTVFELSALWLWSREHIVALATASQQHYLDDAVKQGRGVILLTPHLGAWEMAGLYASLHYPITSLYRPPRLSDLDLFIKNSRERLGATLVPTDRQGIKALFAALKRGEIVGILPDQVPNEAGTGVFAPFFARPAYTMTLVARLARKTGAPVIFTFAERLPLSTENTAHFRVHFLPAPMGIEAEDLIEAATALNQGIMQCIAVNTAQYQWSYKRFKKVPDGEISPYS